MALATPAVSHAELAEAALLAGKDVFVEKPLAVELEQGQKLVGLAEARRRILMVGHVLRYHPAITKMHELIRDGALGKIQYIYSNRLNIGKIRSEENILWSFAPHDISVILALARGDAEQGLLPRRRVSQPAGLRRHLELPGFPERCPGSYLRELAASGEGAEAGDRRLGEDGGVRRHRGQEAAPLPAQGGVEEPRADRGEGPAEVVALADASRSGPSVATSSIASRHAAPRRPTARKVCGCSRCSMRVSARCSRADRS